MNEKRFLVLELSDDRLRFVAPDCCECEFELRDKAAASKDALESASHYERSVYGVFELVATTKTTVQTELEPVGA